jgi:N-acetylglucosamine-6-phosphate deacetylase
MKQTAYLADQIFTGTEWLQQQAVVTKENKIVSILPVAQLPEGSEVKRWQGSFLAPSFIDVQLYGAYGKLLAIAPEPASVQAIADYCRAGGATLSLPTVATNTIEVFRKSIDAVRQYWQEGGQGIYGLHLEGPWINKEKRGAHAEAFIHAPTLDEVKELLAYGKDVIKMITLAPEVCSKEVVDYLLQNGIIVSAGHTNATYAEATQAFDNGITTATHLYNAMSPLGHRQPGMVGALFNHNKAMCSIIPDGHHVDYAAIKIAKKQMGERLFVITDAVTETTSGPYQHQLDGDKYVCNGILSGSALTMHRAMVNLVQQVGIELAEALRMCSLYPAQVLKQEHLYGKIAPGYAAQFVIINPVLELVATVNG